ncbi:NRDE family protein [Trinickia diaoshuihuensis]|uniref:NRDE family protein n=1 Tax=Trinickia diaoshuihuensis TaxID=2292265 RepID=UPI000E23B8A0|nr:NRDE family protein [Trinickia diaoshuihuensis]
MCLIVFDWRPRAGTGALLTLTANRDEFFARASAPLDWWNDAPGVLAGRDLVGAGTWLGLARDGRFAALTNHRDPQAFRPDAPTRGALVADYLKGQRLTPLDYLHEIAERGAAYNGFNLVVGDFTRRELAWYCNRSDTAPSLLPAGVHGISNAVLDTPWPKLVRKRAELGDLLEREGEPRLDALIELMRDPCIAADETLPSTGISLERERALSAAFIETADYGTRGTTALRVVPRGAVLSVQIAERSDDDGSHRIERPGSYERRFTFDLPAFSSRD